MAIDKRRVITVGGKQMKTRLYNIWIGMRSRCRSENCKDYDNYGGRGITVCDEWDNDFLGFHRWSKDNGYKPSLSIDRKDVNGHYCPSNCRWADKWTQAGNKSTSVFVEYEGESKTCYQWGKLFGLSGDTIYQRLFKYDAPWSVEAALTTPSQSRKKASKKVKVKKPEFTF